MPLILAVKVSFSVAVKEIINNAVISIQSGTFQGLNKAQATSDWSP